MFGVLLGTASETLLLPQAPRQRPSAATQAHGASRIASARRLRGRLGSVAASVGKWDLCGSIV